MVEGVYLKKSTLKNKSTKWKTTEKTESRFPAKWTKMTKMNEHGQAMKENERACNTWNKHKHIRIWKMKEKQNMENTKQ